MKEQKYFFFLFRMNLLNYFIYWMTVYVLIL